MELCRTYMSTSDTPLAFITSGMWNCLVIKHPHTLTNVVSWLINPKQLSSVVRKAYFSQNSQSNVLVSVTCHPAPAKPSLANRPPWNSEIHTVRTSYGIAENISYGSETWSVQIQTQPSVIMVIMSSQSQQQENAMKIPDVKRAFLTGAEGARAGTHAAVHHLLPQVVDLGLEATVFWKEKRHRVCQHHLYLQRLFQALVQVLYERRCSLSGAEKIRSAAYWGLINDLKNRWILIMYLHELCTNISCQIIHYAY